MYPQLWTIPVLGLPIYSYGFMIMLGFLFGIFIASRRAKKNNLDPEIIFDLGIIAMITGILGARLAYIIIFDEEFTKVNAWQVFNIFDGGFYTLGVIIGWFAPFALLLWKKKRIPFKSITWLFPLSIISAVILGRIIHLIFHRQDYNLSVFTIWKGGLVFYGGLIVAIPAVLYYLKKKDVNIWTIGDIVAPSVALGLVFGRIGCLLNGCCWGKVTTGNPLAISFPNLAQAGNTLSQHSPVFNHHLNHHLIPPDAMYSLPVYPTQIYEALFALCLFITLSLLTRKRPREGLVLGLLVFVYSIGRFIIEFFRGDKEPVFINLTDSQIISVVLFAGSLAFLVYVFRKQPVVPEDKPSSG